MTMIFLFSMLRRISHAVCLVLGAVILLMTVPLHSAAEVRALSSEGVFKIGVVQSLTGIAAEDGVNIVRSLRLAAEEINANEALQVELVIEDDQSASKNSVAAFNKLAAQGIHAVIGATWDFTTNPLLPLARREKIVVFSTSTLPEALNLKEADGFGFVNAISVQAEARPFEAFIKRHEIKKAIIIFANNPWGLTQLDAYSNLAGRHGVSVLEKVSPSQYDINEWREIVPRIKTLKPEAVVLLLNKADLQTFLRRAKELDLQARFFASKNLWDALRLSQGREEFEGVCCTYPFEQMMGQKDFTARFRQQYKDEARIYADNSYDALFILHKAFQLSQAQKINLADALRTTEYQGLAGRYQYDALKSLSLGTSSLVCISNGRPALIN